MTVNTFAILVRRMRDWQRKPDTKVNKERAAALEKQVDAAILEFNLPADGMQEQIRIPGNY